MGQSKRVGSTPTVASHFTGRSAIVRRIYDRILDAAAEAGPVREEPKKTSIHLSRTTAFAGIATRKDALVLTLKAATDIHSRRIVKREQVSANRWHLDVRLDDPSQVDRELVGWLNQAIDLST